MVWSGLGVNYKGAQATWLADIAYFKSIGMNNVRINLPNMGILSAGGSWQVGTPATSGSAYNVYAYWRQCANVFINAGFYVSFGPGGPASQIGNNLTSTRWSQYHDSVISEASYMQTQGIVLGDFTLGNELESYVDGTTLTLTQLRTNIKQLAVDVKSVYTLGKVSYGCYDNNGSNYSDWIATGLGSIDIFTIHPYGSYLSTQNYGYLSSGGYPAAISALTTLGSKAQVSEFNLEAGSDKYDLLSDEKQITYMRKFYKQIRDSATSKAFIYSYVGQFNSDNQFAMKNIDGSFSPLWDIFLNDNKRTTTIPG